MKKLLSIAASAFIFAGASQAGTVAIVDTGLNPGVLGGSIIGAGINTFNPAATAVDDQAAQHGTAAGVSAVQAAPNTFLLPVKAYGSNFETNLGALDAAFEYVGGQGVHAIAHNIGSITNTSLGALQSATRNGAILVVQAGNAAAPGPTGDARQVPNLGGRGIVAAGVINNTIWSASNRAGDLAEFTLVADVRAPINGWVGTSMATPRIAAVAASVRETHAFLSPEQVVQILFESATDLGAPGTDQVYGRGLVNLNAANTSVGAGQIPAASGGGGGGGGGGSGLGAGALLIGGGVAYVMSNRKESLKKTIFVDKYGRGFNIDLSERISSRSNTPLASLLASRQNPLTIVPVAQSEAGQTIAFVDEGKVNQEFGFDYLADETRIAGFRHQYNNGSTNYAMGLNVDLSSEFGALSFNENSKAGEKTNRHHGQFLYNQVYSTPILGYSAEGSSFKFGWNGQSARQHKLGIAVIDDQEKNGLQSQSILYEGSLNRDRYQLGFQMGALMEDGSLFGGSSDGAFSTDKTNTYYLGFNGSWKVNKRVSLIGGYFQGLSQIEESNNSLLDQFTDIRSEGYGIGLLVNKAFSPKGSFGISYSSPLQATSGSARLTLPTSQNRLTGDIGFESSALSFEGADAEKIIEAYYGYQLNAKTDLFAHFSYTKNPVSDSDLSSDNTVYIGWKRQF